MTAHPLKTSGPVLRPSHSSLVGVICNYSKDSHPNKSLEELGRLLELVLKTADNPAKPVEFHIQPLEVDGVKRLHSRCDGCDRSHHQIVHELEIQHCPKHDRIDGIGNLFRMCDVVREDEREPPRK
jgi:hypothetical protein